MSKNTVGIILAAAGAFVGGVALGMLLAPKSGRENREYLRKSTVDLADWLENQSRDVQSKASKRAHEVAENVRKSVKKNFPDLYDATDSLSMNDDDVLTGKN